MASPGQSQSDDGGWASPMGLAALGRWAILLRVANLLEKKIEAKFLLLFLAIGQ